MKAFKTFSQCPIDSRPIGINLEWPWQVEDCSEENVALKQAVGFTVVSDTEYTTYLSQYQAEMDAWTILEKRKLMAHVSPRQIRQALFLQGITADMIVAALNTLPDPTKSLALIEWEYSVEFHRNRPLVIAAAQMLGWNETQLDDLWALASSL